MSMETKKNKEKPKSQTKKLKTNGSPKIEIFEDEKDKDAFIFWDLVNKYYMLKNKYEKDYKKLQEKSNSKVVPACVNCKRHVGTKFSKIVATEVNHTNGRIFTAKCGDSSSPCSLNINFVIPNIHTFDNIFERDAFKIKQLKGVIIECKNDLMFNYEDEDKVMDFFSNKKGRLNQLLNDNQYSYDLYSSILPDKEKIIELKIEEKKCIDEYKALIDDYKKTSNNDLLRDAMHAYMQINPISKKIREMTYFQNTVEEKNGEYYLIQNELPIVFIETIDRIPVLSEKLQPFIASMDLDEKKPKQKPKETTKPKKIFKKILIVPATEAAAEAEAEAEDTESGVLSSKSDEENESENVSDGSEI